MPPALLLFGLPTWLAIALIGLVLVVVAFAILKRLFKLALIVGAVAAGVWLGLKLLGG
jgi:hypothetical protein